VTQCASYVRAKPTSTAGGGGASADGAAIAPACVSALRGARWRTRASDSRLRW
jgi:hypothetical protein